MPWVMFSTVRGFHDKCGDILGVFSTMGNVMINVGDILSRAGSSLKFDWF